MTETKSKSLIAGFFKDRLSNLITGLGTTAKDKSMSDQYSLTIIDDSQLEAAYRTDWIARKLVDIIAEDMIREGWAWQAKESQIERLEEAETALKLQEKLTQAIIRSRLWGGAGLYIGTDIGGSPDRELKPEQMTKGGIKYIHVFSKRDLNPAELITDPEDPWFGHPRYYDLSFQTIGKSQVQVHPSRIVSFSGKPHPDPLRAGGVAFWGDSVLQIVWDAVKNAASSQQHVAALIPEAKVDVVSVPGLSDMLSTAEGTEKVISRFQGAGLIKSMFGFVLMEGDEDGGGEQYQQKQIRFTEFPDLLRQFMVVAAGAADIPVTRMLNQSPAGLNSTGEGDLRNHYDNIKALQKKDLKPRLDYLFEFFLRHVFGTRPKAIHYTFVPLWQMSAKDKAEIGKIKAETDNALIGQGLVPSDVMSKATRNRLIEEGEHPGIEQAYEEFDADPEAQALENESKGLNPDGTPKDPAEVEGQEPGEEDTDGEQPAGRLPVTDRRHPRRAHVHDATPRSLYVRRQVVNTAEIEAWAKAQGFETIVPDLHVTLIHSREPVDWFKTYTAEARIEIPAGGPRLVEPLGNQGAIVLLFASDTLTWRHEHFQRIGGKSDFPEYQPHITLTYKPNNVEIEKIEPYKGRIILGIEMFDEVRDWSPSQIEEKTL